MPFKLHFAHGLERPALTAFVMARVTLGPRVADCAWAVVCLLCLRRASKRLVFIARPSIGAILPDLPSCAPLESVN